MQVLCNQDQITPRLEYTIDFIFSNLGFNFEIVSTQKFKDSNGLVFGYLNQQELESLKQVNLINIPNFGELNQLENFEKHINIFDINSEKIPILGTTFKSEWEKSKKANYFYSNKSKIWQLEYDIITNIFYHLSRFEERWRLTADERETDWNKSILCRANNLQIPVVDVLLDELTKIIYAKSKKTDTPIIRILPWPKGEKFAVAFTHDIDLTRGYSAKEFLSSKTKSFIYSLLNKQNKKEEINKNLKDKNSNVWTFPQILNFYKKRNWKATFFFLAKTIEGRHIRYNITSEKFQKLFKGLKSNEHEIALHPSLKAFDNSKKYAVEKLHLEKKVGSEIFGMRQHYLRFKIPRIWRLADMAKLKYDSSLVYNYQSGFRAGTSKSFKTFDYNEDEKLNVLEFPITFFEYNLPEKGQNEKKSLEIIRNLVNQVEKYEGIFNILIHPSNFLLSPFKEYWQFFIKKIEKKKVFVSTLSDFTNWLQYREKIHISFKLINSKLVLKIKKPRTIKSFGFEISHNGEFVQTENVEAKELSARRYICLSAKSKLSLIYKLYERESSINV